MDIARFCRCKMAAGFDIKSAYRDYYITPADQKLLGYKLFGLYWYDTRATQGVASMGNICSRHHNQIVEYTDDYILDEPDR